MANSLLPPILAGITPIIVLAVIILGISTSLVAWEPPILWVTEFGTSSPNVDNSVTALTGSSAGLFATGYVGEPFAGGVNPTPSGWFVARYDLNGQRLWFQLFGNLSDYIANAIAVSQNATYVGGVSGPFAFSRAYDLSGNLLWKTQFSGGKGGPAIEAVSVDPSGIYYGGNGYYAPNQTMFVRKYDFAGNLLWARQFGNSTYDSLQGALSGPGGVYVWGNTSGSLGGQTYVGPSFNVFLQKYDPSGGLLWTREFGTKFGATASSIGGDSTGIYVTGNTEGLLSGNSQTAGNAFVRKYDFSGNPLWTVQYGAPDNSPIARILISADVSGVYSAWDSNAGTWVTKYDASGNSARSFQAKHGSSIQGVIPVQGELDIAGATSQPFPGHTVVGRRDAFLAQFVESSSLVFFGINPPLSFLVLATLIGIPTILIVWSIRRTKRTCSRPRIPPALQNIDISS